MDVHKFIDIVHPFYWFDYIHKRILYILSSNDFLCLCTGSDFLHVYLNVLCVATTVLFH